MSKVPHQKYIGNELHKLTVWKVLKTFPNGTPRIMERLPEQGTMHIEGGEEFVTAFIPAINLEDKPPGVSP